MHAKLDPYKTLSDGPQLMILLNR